MAKTLETISKDNYLSMDALSTMLDDEQLEATMSRLTNVLVRANAGAGKTRVLTSRVAYLLANGVREDQIMLLTFTNKASKEMISRVKLLLGKQHVNLLSGTFHHISTVFLRKYAEQLGYSKQFTVIDPDDAKSLINSILKEYLTEQKMDKKELPDKKEIYQWHSQSINQGIPIDLILPSQELMHLNHIETVLERYEKKKKLINTMDFDDLLVYFTEILKKNSIRREIVQRFQYVLVDEYQDINHLQHEIVELLNYGVNHLFVVGDVQQAIYRWRGSNDLFMANFHREHDDVEDHYITNNYRSDGEILRLAEYVINRGGDDQQKTKIVPVLPSVNKPILHESYNDYEQANYLVEKIREVHQTGIPYHEIAILLRSNYLVRMVEWGLRQNNIPYKVIAGYSFFERKHIKDILAFLRLLANNKDESALMRIASLYPGMGEKTVERLVAHYREKQYDFISLHETKLTSRALTSVQELESLLLLLKGSLHRPIKEIIHSLLTKFYLRYLKEEVNDDKDLRLREKDISDLLTISETYKDLSSFLSDVLLDDTKTEEKTEKDQVIVTTVHQAKGLEWDCVMLPYMNEGIFPSGKRDEIDGLTEERRLLYVAITRARKKLFMSYIDQSTITQKTMFASQFLDGKVEELVIAE